MVFAPCGQEFTQDLQSKAECHCNSHQCSGTARRICRSMGVLSVELLTYHATTALVQLTVALQWWRVEEWIVKLGAVLIISIVLAVFTQISVCWEQYKQSKCSQSWKFSVSVADKIFCRVASMILGSAVFIPMSWVVGKNSPWPSRRVQMVG